MRICPKVRIALKALRRNPMRAMLTTLGIVIGVGAVIAMVEIGAGSSSAIQKRIASMGANVLIVIPSTAATGGVTHGSGSALTLTPGDAEAIVEGCPSVRGASPIVRARAQVVYGNRNWVPESIEGVTGTYLQVREWEVAEGEVFTGGDVAATNAVCLLGRTVVNELFKDESPLGKEVRVRNVSLRVVGVLKKKGANLMGQDQDDILLAPWTTIKYRVAGGRLQNMNQSSGAKETNLYPGQRNLYPEEPSTRAKDTPMLVRFDSIDAIMAAAKEASRVSRATEEITEALRARHAISPGEPDDFEIINLTEITGTLSATSSLMTNLLLCLAAISLVVGGVGIMNIMLVSVTERTKEIGLRIAVGARSGDILRQFLVEAVTLSLVGGAIGIMLGNGASYAVGRILRWPVETTPLATVVAVLVSATVGIFFGFFPAWKASRLDPIEALRYE
ncbi:MAG: ABC transporter permease [Thermodesulfobacteriota bacterium]